jgi:hypothetical protein
MVEFIMEWRHRPNSSAISLLIDQTNKLIILNNLKFYLFNITLQYKHYQDEKLYKVF